MVPPMIVASRTETRCSCNELPNAQELTALWMVPLEMRECDPDDERGGRAARAECDRRTAKIPVIQAPTNGGNEGKEVEDEMGGTSGDPQDQQRDNEDRCGQDGGDRRSRGNRARSLGRCAQRR